MVRLFDRPDITSAAVDRGREALTQLNSNISRGLLIGRLYPILETHKSRIDGQSVKARDKTDK